MVTEVEMTYKRLVSAGETNVSVTGFNVLCPSAPSTTLVGLPYWVTVSIFYTVCQKIATILFVHNVAKCWPISKSLCLWNQQDITALR